MFSWICPKCGRDVPPSYTDCPNCAANQSAAAAAPAAGPAPPQGYPPPSQAPAYAPQAAAPAPPPPYAPAQGGYAQAPPQGYPPPPHGYPRRHIPEWAVVLGTVVVIGLLAAGAYFFLLPSRQTASAKNGKASTEAVAAPEGPVSTVVSKHPYARHLDIAGIRLIEEKGLKAKFVIVNHSSADMSSIPVVIRLSRVGSKPDEEPLTTAAMELPSLGPYESKEITVPVKAKLRAYEMPDWQFIRGEVEIKAEP